MKFLLLRGLVLFSLLGFAASACDQGDACKKAPECARQGKCSANGSGACVVASDADCKESEPCKLHGKCSMNAAACVASKDADCKGSEDCQKLSMCSAYQGGCINPANSIQPECAKTCETEGLCVKQGEQCVALSRRHC